MSCREVFSEYQIIKEKLGSSFEAKELISFVLGRRVTQSEMPFVGEFNQKQMDRLDALVGDRISGKPLQYLLGEWEFYSLPFFVGEGVLIPRADTEVAVDTVIELSHEFLAPEIVDLCSGSGCIAISIEKNTKNRCVTAIELSKKAFSYLEKNIALNASCVKAINSDVCKYTHIQPISILVSNPPYISSRELESLQTEVKYEPEMALDGGESGTEFYRIISSRFYDQIAGGGYICFEIGMGQEKEVCEILLNSGFNDVKTKKDLCGIVRVVYGKK